MTAASLLVAAPLPLLELLLVVTWSSGFVGARLSIGFAPAFLVVVWRCIVVSLMLLPWVARDLVRLARVSPRGIMRQAAVGVLAMAGYLAGVIKGIELGVPAGLAALIAGLLPVGTALISTIVLRERLAMRVWLGLAIGLAGMALVMAQTLSAGAAPLWAYAMPFAGMLSLAIATLWQKRIDTARAAETHATEARAELRPGPLCTLWLQCTASIPCFALMQAWHGDLWPSRHAGFVVSVLWTAVLSSLGGYGLYWLCLQRTSPTRVASVLYASPAVTALWAYAMFGEPLSWTMAFGAAVSALGVGLVMNVRAA